jgi:hypothetical protein
MALISPIQQRLPSVINPEPMHDPESEAAST